MGGVTAPHDQSTAPAAEGSSQASAHAASATPNTTLRPRRVTTAAAAPAVTGALERVAAQFAARSVGAVAVAGFRSPMIAEIERLQQFVPPLKSVIDQTFARLTQQHNALWRSAFAVSSISVPWWTYTELWPTDALMTSLMRPLDVVRPQLLDLSRTLDNILGATRWIGQLNTDLWRELRHTGQRIAFWAVHGAQAALERGDMRALEQFVRDWLDVTPTTPRMEALVEALLEIDATQYAPDEGTCLLHDLRDRVQALTTDRRREHETLLGLRRGAGSIARIAHPEATVLYRPGLPGGPSLEDSVLDRFQPDVDPRLVELVNELPPADQKIVLMKTVAGCAWATAAVTCGQPAARGETVRRRLSRRRDTLPLSTDPWSELPRTTMTPQKRATFGRVRPNVIFANGTSGIWP